ncbi:stressosome-associated protein Prli42 [Gorillibacterium timonense]|nr:stressosome-associated protein Prli42 [Gorillibacterium timonense]
MKSSKFWFRVVLWLMIGSMLISTLMYVLEAFVQPF